MNPEQKPYSPDQPAENFGRKAAAQTECTPLESALVYQKYEEIRCVAVRDYRIRRPLTLRLVFSLAFLYVDATLIWINPYYARRREVAHALRLRDLHHICVVCGHWRRTIPGRLDEPQK